MGKQNPFEATKAKLAAVGVLAPEPSERARVKLQPVIGKLAEAVDLVVGKGQNKLFLRGDAVVKIEYDPNQGDYDFAPMKDTEFVTWIERHLSFGVEVQQKDEGGELTGKTIWREKSIPLKVARLILDAPQFKDQLPRVVRKNRVRLPVLRSPVKEGDVGVCELLPPGFDEESGGNFCPR